MGLVKIFVEGDGDKKFILDVTKFCTFLDINDDIIITGGCDQILSHGNAGEAIRTGMQKNYDNNGTNLVIFDADDDFEEREESLIQWSIDYNLYFDLFLFPNHNENGDLESLLEKIINPVHFEIFRCWNQYENCISQSVPTGRAKGYTIPARKSKIYSYLEVLHGDTNSEKKLCKDAFRNYLLEENWNLRSVYLNPLIEFLQRNLMV